MFEVYPSTLSSSISFLYLSELTIFKYLTKNSSRIVLNLLFISLLETAKSTSGDAKTMALSVVMDASQLLRSSSNSEKSASLRSALVSLYSMAISFISCFSASTLTIKLIAMKRKISINPDIISEILIHSLLDCLLIFKFFYE